MRSLFVIIFICGLISMIQHFSFPTITSSVKVCQCKSFVEVDIKKSTIYGAGDGAFARSNISSGTVLMDIKCDNVSENWGSYCFMIPYDRQIKEILTTLSEQNKPLTQFAIKHFLVYTSLENCDLRGNSKDKSKEKCFLVSFDKFLKINHSSDRTNIRSPEDGNHEISAAAIVAARNIEEGEELLQNYVSDFGESDTFLMRLL